jgi:transcriptional regulator with XRE-family HTH domain
MVTLKAQFMSNLKELREMRGLSQEKLAERVGVSLTFIAHIEGGRKSPSFETMELLGQALGVHPYRLLIPPMPLDPSTIEQTTEGLQEVVRKMFFAVQKLPGDTSEG